MCLFVSISPKSKLDFLEVRSFKWVYRILKRFSPRSAQIGRVAGPAFGGFGRGRTTDLCDQRFNAFDGASHQHSLQQLAAVVGPRIAVSITNEMGQPPEPFVLSELFGVNMSFATPMAQKTNLLVMNAECYAFPTFVRVGVPLLPIMRFVFSWRITITYRLR